jgi:hypothetical protein
MKYYVKYIETFIIEAEDEDDLNDKIDNSEILNNKIITQILDETEVVE